MQTKQIFSAMKVLSWIIFIGYCIKAGAMTLVFVLSFFVTKNATENLYMGIDFFNLFEFSTEHYTLTFSLLILITCLKAYLFYFLIMVFKALDFDKPFNMTVVNLIFKISYIAISIGLLGAITNSYMTWLVTKVTFTQVNSDASGYVFMAGVVFIVATLFKRATEIQSENELTI